MSQLHFTLRSFLLKLNKELLVIIKVSFAEDNFVESLSLVVEIQTMYTIQRNLHALYPAICT